MENEALYRRENEYFRRAEDAPHENAARIARLDQQPQPCDKRLTLKIINTVHMKKHSIRPYDNFGASHNQPDPLKIKQRPPRSEWSP